MSGLNPDSRPLSADGIAAARCATQEGAPGASLPGTSLPQAIADYLTWHALRGSSARHQGDLRRMLAAFARACGADRPLAQIGRSECEAFLRTFQERDCKPNTLKAYHRVLDAFFRWLVAEERLSESPMRRVPKPRLPQEQVQPLTPGGVGAASLPAGPGHLHRPPERRPSGTLASGPAASTASPRRTGGSSTWNRTLRRATTPIAGSIGGRSPPWWPTGRSWIRISLPAA